MLTIIQHIGSGIYKVPSTPTGYVTTEGGHVMLPEQYLIAPTGIPAEALAEVAAVAAAARENGKPEDYLLGIRAAMGLLPAPASPSPEAPRRKAKKAADAPATDAPAPAEEEADEESGKPFLGAGATSQP